VCAAVDQPDFTKLEIKVCVRVCVFVRVYVCVCVCGYRGSARLHKARD